MAYTKDTKSFHQWCIENDRKDLLERWDYDLTAFSADDITCNSHKDIWLKCDANNSHKSERHNIHSSVCSHSRHNTTFTCKQCASFGQWCTDEFGSKFLEKHWCREKNIKSPYEVSAKGDAVIYIVCQDVPYHGSYKTTCYNFSKGKRCPFCVGKQTCIEDSFGRYHELNKGSNFIERYWSEKNTIDPYALSVKSSKRVWIKCPDNDAHNDYDTRASHFSDGFECPYCSHKRKIRSESAGCTHPITMKLWSDYNTTTPYDHYAGSADVVWWKCDHGVHDDYTRSFNQSYDRDFRCPECVRERTESVLQEKVRLYLTESLGYEVKHERGCSIIAKNQNHLDDGRFDMPYDNEVVELKLIIEVQGKQHDIVCLFHEKAAEENNTTPEHELHMLQQRDKYKKCYALHHGYHFLEVSHLDEKNDHYKQVIDAKIESILADTTYAAI